MSNDNTNAVTVVSAGELAALETKSEATYKDYVTFHGISTKELCAEHAALAVKEHFPGIRKSSRADNGTLEYRAYVTYTKVRNGLSRAAGIEASKRKQAPYLLTTLALSEDYATLSDNEFVARILAERDDRSA